MSDRARSSVRTGAREGSGTADVVPEAAGPVDDGSTGASAAGARTPAAPPAEPEQVPAARTSGGGAAATGEPAAAVPAQAADAPARQRSAPAEPAAQAPQVPAPPAAHPVTPLGPAAGRQAPDGARAAGTPAPPVPPSTGTRPAVGRSGGPAGGPLPVDSTQAVQLLPGAARPVDPSSRPPAARPADARPADARPTDARPTDSSRPAAETSGRGGRVRGAGRGPRRARLQLRHIDTFSALKISLVTSIVLFLVWMIAVAILYGVLGGLGVFDSLNEVIGQLSTSTGAEEGDVPVITAGIVLGGAAVIGAVNVVLLTALCTVTAFIYNLLADMVGGLEVTLAERE